MPVRPKKDPSTAHSNRRTSEQVHTDVLRIVAERGGQCKSLDFKNRDSRMVLQCAEGHVWRTSVGAILGGSWCHVCRRKHITATIRRHFGVLDLDDADEIALYAESLDLTFVTGDPPRQGRTDFFQCDEGHLWEVSREMFTGTWCPACGRLGTGLGVGRIVR